MIRPIDSRIKCLKRAQCQLGEALTTVEQSQ